MITSRWQGLGGEKLPFHRGGLHQVSVPVEHRRPLGEVSGKQGGDSAVLRKCDRRCRWVVRQFDGDWFGGHLSPGVRSSDANLVTRLRIVVTQHQIGVLEHGVGQFFLRSHVICRDRNAVACLQLGGHRGLVRCHSAFHGEGQLHPGFGNGRKGDVSQVGDCSGGCDGAAAGVIAVHFGGNSGFENGQLDGKAPIAFHRQIFLLGLLVDPSALGNGDRGPRQKLSFRVRHSAGDGHLGQGLQLAFQGGNRVGQLYGLRPWRLVLEGQLLTQRDFIGQRLGLRVHPDGAAGSVQPLAILVPTDGVVHLVQRLAVFVHNVQPHRLTLGQIFVGNPSLFGVFFRMGIGCYIQSEDTAICKNAIVVPTTINGCNACGNDYSLQNATATER